MRETPGLIGDLLHGDCAIFVGHGSGQIMSRLVYGKANRATASVAPGT
jgi:hypothetical protein